MQIISNGDNLREISKPVFLLQLDKKKKKKKKKFNMSSAENVTQGPVVQSVVSLTSSLRAISLTILADSIYNFLKFFAEKM